jgi:hypothetical protein
MSLRSRLNDHGAMIRIGISCLIIANLARRFLHPTTGIWSSLSDGATGVLFGISIGSNLMGVKLAGRPACAGGK